MRRLAAAALLLAVAWTARAGGDAPPPVVTLGVHVVTDDDAAKAVAGAKVVVRDRDTDVAAGRTDADGRVTLSVTWNRSFVLEVSGGGRGHWIDRVPWKYEAVGQERRAASASSAEVRLPSGAPLRGRVLDAASGAPIAGARACLTTERAGAGGFREAELPRATTGADGAFLFEGLSLGGGFRVDRVVVFARGRVAVLRDLQREAVVRGDVGTFRLDPAGTIRGRLLRGDGTPAAGDLVAMESDFIWSPDGDRADAGISGNSVLEALAIRAGPDGTFEYPHAAFGVSYEASTYRHGGQGDRRVSLMCDDVARGMRVTRDRPVTDVVLRATDDLPPAPVSLYVAVAAASASVRLTNVAGALSTPDGDRQFAWAEGNPLAFSRVPPGRWRLTVTARNVPEWTGDVEVDAKTVPSRATVTVGGRETIEGRVLDDAGAPVAVVRVRWHAEGVWTWPDGWPGDAGTTGAKGEFRIAGLTPGRYCLRAEDAHGVATAVVTVAATAKDATIIMPRTGAVRVRLEAPPGDVVPWNVWCSPGRPSVDASTLTVTRLPVGRRTFDVELRDDAYGKTHLLPVHVDADVRAGETTDLGVVKLDTGVAVSGVVVGPDGKPVVDASVSSGVAGARTAEDGRFTLSPLPRGRVTLEAKQDRLVAQAAVDTTVQGDVTVRLVRARIVLADAAALGRRRDFGVRARPRGATRDAWPLPLPQMDHDARFGGIDAGGVAALPLPPGDWTLEAVSEGDVVLASSDVTVPGDGDGPVRVTLPPK